METACSDCKYSKYVGGFCAALYCCVYHTYIQHEYFGIHAMRVLPMSAVLCGRSVLPIVIRYQVSGVRYCLYSQYLDYCLFSGFSAIMRVQYASCSPSNFGVYCMLSAATPCVPLLLLLFCCWCCGWVCTAAAAVTDRSSSDACYYSCYSCCCYFLFMMLCRCCYRFYVRERPSLLFKRCWK